MTSRTLRMLAIGTVGVVACCLAGCNAPAPLTTGTQSTLPFGEIDSLWGMTVDSAGNVFASDGSSGNHVLEVPHLGSVRVLPFTGLLNPGGLAVDVNGNLFVCDTSHDRVVELSADDVQTTLPFTGLSKPSQVAVDAVGDVFVADPTHARVVELPGSGGAQVTVPLTGIGTVYGIAVDTVGDLFAADTTNNAIVEMTASGVQTTLPITTKDPTGVAVDVRGDVFASDQVDKSVVELPSGGTQVTLGFANLSDPQRLGVDGNGDVYVGDTEQVDELHPTGTVPSAPTLSSVATAGAGAVTLSWTPPSSVGGSPVTSYTVTVRYPYWPLNIVTFPTTATTETITGLTSGLKYRFSLSADNADGNGTESAISNPIQVP